MRASGLHARPGGRPGRSRRLHLLRRSTEPATRDDDQGEGVRRPWPPTTSRKCRSRSRRRDAAGAEDRRHLAARRAGAGADADDSELSSITEQPRRRSRSSASSTRTPATSSSTASIRRASTCRFQQGTDRSPSGSCSARRRRPAATLRAAAGLSRACSWCRRSSSRRSTRTPFALRDKTILKFDREKVDGLELTSRRHDAAVRQERQRLDDREAVAARADFGAVEGALERLASAQMQGIAETERRRPRSSTASTSRRRRSPSRSGSSRATLMLGKTENAVVFAKDASRPMVFTVAPTLARPT